MSQIFNLVVFTASQPEYADAVLDSIDKQRLIMRRYYRDVRKTYHFQVTNNLPSLVPNLLKDTSSASIYSMRIYPRLFSSIMQRYQELLTEVVLQPKPFI